MVSRGLNSTIGLQEVDTEGTRAALDGETGTDIFPDYRGVDVLSAYKPLDISGLEWVIMSEIDEAEVARIPDLVPVELGESESARVGDVGEDDFGLVPLGEGIDKGESDFAAEVAAAASGS